MTAINASTTVYVIGAYIPNGGTLMAYHVARLFHLRFGFPVMAVTVEDETPDHGVFEYDPIFPSIPLAGFEQSVSRNDILICNPSFSDRNFGLKLDCLKITYVQDFKTYRFIDRFFDHYVAVSDFIHDFLLTTYGLETAVIPPFIANTAELSPTAWNDRPECSVLVSAKGGGDLPQLLRQRLHQCVRSRAPDIAAAIDWDAAYLDLGRKIPQLELCRKLGSVRYLLSLTAAEGFGLVPLEAMAMGTTVVGFDAFGGRHYMRSGQNCLARAYPDIEGVANDLIALIRSPALGAQLAEAGPTTAAAYGYGQFRAAWELKLTEIVGGLVSNLNADSTPMRR
jgi:hypothetical protein